MTIFKVQRISSPPVSSLVTSVSCYQPGANKLSLHYDTTQFQSPVGQANESEADTIVEARFYRLANSMHSMTRVSQF
jgi:hypothetical protein